MLHRWQGFAALLVSAAILGLAGCGGSDETSSEPSAQEVAGVQAVMAVGDKLQQAYADRDTAAICGLIDPDDIEKQFRKTRICVRFLNAAFKNVDQDPDYSFDEVTVDGDTAVATAEGADGGSDNTIHLRKTDGKWKIRIVSEPDASASGSGAEQDQ